MATADRELTAGRRERLLWTGDGMAHVRLPGAQHADPDALQLALAATVAPLGQVAWAYAAPFTELVVAAVDGDGGVDELLEAVGQAEAELAAVLDAAREQAATGEGDGVAPDDPDGQGGHDGQREHDGQGDLDGQLRRDELGRDGHLSHPGDTRPLRRQLLGLGADVVALGAGVTGRVLRLARVPVEATAPLAMIDGIPWLRDKLERAVGEPATEVGLALASAVAAGFTQGVSGVTADIAHRAALAAEHRARQRAWEQYAPVLHAATATAGPATAPTAATATAGNGRGPATAHLAVAARDGLAEPPPPLHGPVERVTTTLTPAAVGASGLALTAGRSARLAGQMLLAGLPRPATHGRDVFAARTSAVIAARGGLVLVPDALRLLDRIDTAVIDTGVLLTGTWSLEGVERLREPGPRTRKSPEERIAELLDVASPERRVTRGGWRLEPLPDGADLPRGGVAKARRLGRGGRVVLLLSYRGDPVALAAARPRPDPYAHALVAGARDAGLRVLLAGRPHPVLGALSVDGAVPGGRRLAASVRRLQREEDAGVALVSDRADALRAAHLGVGTVRDGEPVPWAADVLSVTGLEAAALLLGSCATARESSRRGAAFAAGGSAVGGTLALAGRRHGAATAGHRAVGAVNIAALAAMGSAAWSAGAARRRHLTTTPDEQPWHVLPATEALRRLETEPEGLSAEEAEGRHVDDEHAPPSLGEVLADELETPLTPLLGAAAALSATLGSLVDGGLVGGVLGGNALVGAWQRMHTERAIANLLHAATGTVHVLRRGVDAEIEASNLVPGDIVHLRAGDAIPADARLIDAQALEVDESSLTGESLPVPKDARAVADVPVTDRCCMVYAGTSVASGEGRGVVVAVGADTEAARAAHMQQGSGRSDGVEARLAELTQSTLRLSAGGGAAVGISGLLRGVPADSVLGTAVNLAIAAVPEGLPILASMAQLAAARRLSQRGTLVRAPATIEALGRVDVLCVDKTGTLTEGRIRLRRVADARGEEHAGNGLSGTRREVLAVALRATPEAREPADLPHATDRAVLRGARSAGVAVGNGEPGWERLAELPFEPARGYHATVGRTGGRTVVSVKGAPEVVLPLCTGERNGKRGTLGARARAARLERVTGWAREGLRVLAVAEGPYAGDDSEVDPERLGGLELVGFVAFADRVRETAREAVAGARAAGVDVVMVTGDHPTTAQAIAAELGLLERNGVRTGADLDRMTDERLTAELDRIRVFARVTPAQKVRIVRALQRAGHVVAMTGDGANDAPAITLADVGIALGGSRSAPAAREVADMVVTDDRVETVIDALVEGRALWASVHDALAILIGGNLGEIAYTVLGGLTSRTPVLGPRQLLLVNLLTDLAPAAAIAVRPPVGLSSQDLIEQGPEASLGDSLSADVVARAAATAGGALAGYLGGRMTGTQARARTVGLVALVYSQLGQTLVTGGRHPSVLAASGLSAAALATVVQTPGLSRLFGCRPMGPVGWTIGMGAAAAATGASLVAPGLVRRVATALEAQ